MSQTITMPIGIIDLPTPAGATFRLTPQGQDAELRCQFSASFRSEFGEVPASNL